MDAEGDSGGRAVLCVTTTYSGTKEMPEREESFVRNVTVDEETYSALMSFTL